LQRKLGIREIEVTHLSQLELPLIRISLSALCFYSSLVRWLIQYDKPMFEIMH
jgi:hypothetical protein